MRIVRRPKKSVATVLLIHGIGSSGESWREIIEQLPDNVKIIVVDLLGFGRSPKPDWVTYNAKRQAQSIAFTYLRKGLRRPAIIVGHSLGGLVAVEIARQYPRLARSLILCSPPFYRIDAVKKSLIPRREKVLLDIYRAIHNHPEGFARITARAIKYKFIDSGYKLEGETVATYAGALEASIVNQTSFNDALQLNLPIDIIHGSLDPVVVKANLEKLTRQKPNIHLTNVRAGHEVKGKMIPVLLAKLDRHINT